MDHELLELLSAQYKGGQLIWPRVDKKSYAVVSVFYRGEWMPYGERPF